MKQVYTLCPGSGLYVWSPHTCEELEKISGESKMKHLTPSFWGSTLLEYVREAVVMLAEARYQERTTEASGRRHRKKEGVWTGDVDL